MSIEIAVAYSGRMAHQRRAAEAMLAGLRRHGIEPEECDLDTTSPSAPTVVCWGWRYGKLLRLVGKDVLVMERGYLGDRMAWTSLGWNGLNGRATFPNIDDPSRFRQHFAHLLKPWSRLVGGYALIMGQVDGDMSVYGVDLRRWYAETAETLNALGWTTLFRQHPMQQDALRPCKLVPGTANLKGTLADALAGASLVVTYNSNSGVDAILAGVPTVAVDRGSMAWPVTHHNIFEINSEPLESDRETWAARLAWCQWSRQEIADGTAWEHQRPIYDRLARELPEVG